MDCLWVHWWELGKSYTPYQGGHIWYPQVALFVLIWVHILTFCVWALSPAWVKALDSSKITENVNLKIQIYVSLTVINKFKISTRWIVQYWKFLLARSMYDLLIEQRSLTEVLMTQRFNFIFCQTMVKIQCWQWYMYKAPKISFKYQV